MVHRVEAIADRLIEEFEVQQDISIFKIAESCRTALKKIGHFQIEKKIHFQRIKNYTVKLPCNPFKIMAVVKVGNYDDYTNNIAYTASNGEIKLTVSGGNIISTNEKYGYGISNGDYTSGNTLPLKDMNYVPQITGEYIDYKETANGYLNFNVTDSDVAIEYTAVMTDENGFPLIPESCFDGCLYYCLYKYFQPKVIIGQIDMNRFAMIEGWKNTHINQSRSGILSRNDIDKVFNILTSMDRKSYNIDI